ncbi:MAG TPA: GNAT family N-acetyltransferase [Bacillota bacterium]|nr:GNAT family N-acetyltransferase [Bacillota bacterium]HPF42665.1 GNAT family N-acetyltransferase [Bacillota bacterium]HPJ85429.1 GNAT family N-acetyltransferase [Bacillota bacterium]HPQ61275.1 GNAT family N-acetyltransferase [Bacillota bacterium]HRX91774.1 GNAT family N-acetyltransferase [Candidatus Izemoplasmatales bacterium]
MIRNSLKTDPVILEKIARVVARGLNSEGISQWSLTYPSLQDFANDHEDGSLLIYESEGTILGSVTIKPENDPAYAKIIWEGKNAFVIHRLMVLPEARMKGIGKTLFMAAIEKAKTSKADSVKVDTHPDNLRMQRLILKMGFKRKGYLESINRIGYELILH